VRKADLLGALAVLVVVAAVVADEAALLFVAAAVLVLMLGADRGRPARRSTPTGFDPDVGYPARLTEAHVEVEAVRMADKREQQTEQQTEDTSSDEAGAVDEPEPVVVQQGDDLVSFQGTEEVDRRPIIDDDAPAEAEGGSNATNG
jgi:hypothetical protein